MLALPRRSKNATVLPPVPTTNKSSSLNGINNSESGEKSYANHSEALPAKRNQGIKGPADTTQEKAKPKKTRKKRKKRRKRKRR